MRSPFSDLISGCVSEYNNEKKYFYLVTRGDEKFKIYLKTNTYAQIIRNLGEAYHDCTSQVESLLMPGTYLFSYSIFYPGKDNVDYIESQFLIFIRDNNGLVFEKNNWWIQQIAQIADFYIASQFSKGIIDYTNYRSYLTLSGHKKAIFCRQESAIISRLIYGFATTYLLTGKSIYLEAAVKGCQYLQENFKNYDEKLDIIYWTHAIDIENGTKHKLLGSEFSDDKGTIPLYEQIYVLAGLTQTFRITGSPSLLSDIRKTIAFFDKCYFDPELDGYFSHVDEHTLNPLSENLKDNKAKKNWNSIGDHIPAYLINLWLALHQKEDKQQLKILSDLLFKHAQGDPNSKFMHERFERDWKLDKTYKWQQDRGIVGHNMKLMWNLTRVYHLFNDERYANLIAKIGNDYWKIGFDQQRSGWYDALEVSKQINNCHQFSFHDRKTWWQQEQAILAYLISHSIFSKRLFLDLAHESIAFYNAFFLDHEDGGVYFSVLADGMPYVKDIERFKSSHSMSGYHATELAYLAHVYTNLYVKKQPIILYFSIDAVNAFSGKCYVAPDILPKHYCLIKNVWLNGDAYTKFDNDDLIISLPEGDSNLNLKVELVVRS